MRHYDSVLGGSEDLGGDIPRRTTFLIEKLLLSDPTGQSEISKDVVFALIFVDSDHYVF